MPSSTRPATERRRPSVPPGPRPLSPYPDSIDDPTLEAVLRPLLSRAEPGVARGADLEMARARLVDHARPTDAEPLVALLDEAALDLGAPAPEGRPVAPRTATERRGRARTEQARAARLDYLGVLLTAACLHPGSQRRVAAILTGKHEAVVRERAALRVALSSAPLTAPLLKALVRVLDRAPRAPSASERNLLSNAARALRKHLPAADAVAALAPYLGSPALEAPGGEARALMILADLGDGALEPEWRPVLTSLLGHPALASAAGELLGADAVEPEEARAAAAALGEQLDRGEAPDGHLIWLVTRTPPAGSEGLFVRLLAASPEPDWAVVIEGLTRLLPSVADPVALGEALAHWVLDHRERTGRPGSWEGYEAVTTLARSLVRVRRA